MTKPLSEPGAEHVHVGGELRQIKPRPSSTRSESLRRASLRRSAMAGNQRALKFGINAEVHNLPEVAMEVELIYATHEHLHPLEDFRLVELTATTHVKHRRALLGIEKEGMTPTLTRYEMDTGKRLERLERAVHERNVMRMRARQREEAVDLSAYQRAKVVSK